MLPPPRGVEIKRIIHVDVSRRREKEEEEEEEEEGGGGVEKSPEVLTREIMERLSLH